MSNRYYEVVEIFKVEYGNVSYSGNPSRILHTSRGTFKTLPDAGFVYGMSSNESYEGKKFELTLTPGGKVTNMRELTGGLKDVVAEFYGGGVRYA